LRKAAIGFAMSDGVCIRLSVWPHGTSRLLPNGFPWNFCTGAFAKICREN